MNEKLNNPEKNQSNSNASNWESLSEVPFAGSRIGDIDKAQAMAEAADTHMSIASKAHQIAKNSKTEFQQSSAEHTANMHQDFATIAEERAAREYDGIEESGPIEDIDKARVMAEAENLSRSQAADENRAASIIESENYPERKKLVQELRDKGFDTDEIGQIFSHPEAIRQSAAKRSSEATRRGEDAGILYDTKSNKDS